MASSSRQITKNIENVDSTEDSQSSVEEYSDNEYNSKNNNSATAQTKSLDKKLLSSILARVAALEKENKDLKNEINNKERCENDYKNMKTYEKKSKRHQPSLTPSSSEQESEDIAEVYLNNIICNIFITYTLIYT